MQIPSWPQVGERERELLRQVLESPQWGGFHPFVAEFEQRFANYQHSPFGISAFNGTVTLELALTVLGVGPGHEVIVPAISFIATATAVSRVGAVPVFADIEDTSFNIDPERVREALSPRTRAIIPVHFGGVMCDMDRLSAIATDAGIPLVEDAAHAHGSEWNGRRAGSLGLAGSFSFQNGKVLTAGEGGMLVTSDAALAERARSIANCGRVAGRSFYEHARLGTNFRMSAWQAAVLLAQFEQLPQQIATRHERATLLKCLLAGQPGLEWQTVPRQSTQTSNYLLIGRVAGRELRDELCRRLTAAGVPCTPFYPHSLPQNDLYRDVPCRVLPCPVTEARLADAFWLPHRVLLAEEPAIREIAAVMRDVFENRPDSR